MKLQPRILVLVPVTDIRCAAGHPLDILPQIYRREWWERCRYSYGHRRGLCTACVYLRPAGEKFVAVTDATLDQMRLLKARDATVLEIAEHVAHDAAVLRLSRNVGDTRGTA